MNKRETVGYFGKCTKHGIAVRLEVESGRRLFNWSNGEMYCVSCRRALVWDAIKGRASEMQCGVKCTSATGPSCDCSCEGHNHGRAVAA